MHMNVIVVVALLVILTIIFGILIVRRPTAWRIYTGRWGLLVGVIVLALEFSKHVLHR